MSKCAIILWLLFLTHFNTGFYDCLHVSRGDDLVLQRGIDEGGNGGGRVIALVHWL